MVTRSNIRLGITGALLLFALGAFAGCTDVVSPDVEVAMEGERRNEGDSEDPQCTIIDGIMVCEGTH